MDIICARCGKHLNSIEAARAHRCRDISDNEPFQFKPSKRSKISPEEWDQLVSSINAKDTPSERSAIKSAKEATKDRRRREVKKLVPDWAVALILIFALTLIGFAIGRFTKTEIPFYLLLGFSVIYSIEKWLRYYIRTSKSLGKIYRLVINVSILALLGLIIWSGVQLFSQQFLSNSVVGSIIFVAELVLFIWMWRVVSKNSWRWPSMKLTVFSLICLFLIFSFAGVQPLNEYKYTIFNKVSDFFASNSQTSNSGKDSQISGEDILTTENFSEGNDTNTSASTTTIVSNIDSRTGEYKNYYLGLVKTSTGVLSGSECYGEFIILINNEDARNPTYLELVDFLKTDKTDTYPYQLTLSALDFYYGNAEDNIDLDKIADIIDGNSSPSAPRICADFAERLHNEAEKAGIRCGYVDIDSLNHALCVFETTNSGLVFIDDTGKSYGFGPSNCDKVVEVEEGKEYIPMSLFPEAGWSDTWESLGIVEDIFITWDGDWR